ncbi:ras GEF [Piromyces finnis]|uniref:Ras GEF n=1 Tax=Piromyces finnis TaxID=1754191 RepID=A0A1Y1V2I5_9FUNG|nr:ras GEF [Piromyces finnis]|eukprot:ORX45619.1 ras GEF [Piromyces finnis]
MKGIKLWKKENDVVSRENENKFENRVSTLPMYEIDRESFHGQSLFNTCLGMNENELKKNIKKSWNLMLNGIDTPLDDYGNTALHLATIQNDYELVSLLLLKGADPNVRNNGNVKPRMIAKIMEFPDIYKILLMHENEKYMNFVADYSQKNDENSNDNKTLIDQNCNSSTTTTIDNNNNNNGNNSTKGKSRRQKVSKLLYSLNFDDGECQNIIPSQISNSLPSNENLKELKNNNNNDDSNRNNNNNISKLHNILDKNINDSTNSIRNSTFGSTINKVNEDYNIDNNSIYTNFSNVHERQKNHQNHKKYFPKYYLTIFNMAYLGIYKEHIYSLLDSTMIEESDENGSTPLMKASYRGHVNVVEKLIEKKANVNACDNMGYPALIWAALKGHSKVCEILVKHGADVNSIYGKGKSHSVVTPLIAAAYSGSKNTVISLINLGADINKAVGPGNTTALMVATLKYKFDIVNELLNRGAQFDNDITWISNCAFFMKILEKGHNHWMVNENFIDSIIMDNGNSANTILTHLKNQILKENSKKTSIYTKQDKKNIKDMQSIYQHYILKNDNPEMKHVISSSIIKKNNSSMLSNESICIERNQKIKNKYTEIEEIFENCHYTPIIHELIQLIPLYGTDLDTMWFNILRCSFQLIELVNKNEKSQYMYLYSKCEYYLGIFTKEISKIIVIYNVDNKKEKNNYSLFNNTLLIAKIKDMLLRTNNELYKLYYDTTFAISCWPPMGASQNMVGKMINLVKETFYLTKLANATGYFQKIDTELTFEYKIEENFDNENITDFQTYQQLNNLKNYGKNIDNKNNEMENDNKKNELALSMEEFNTERDDNQLDFCKDIDDHIHHIEHASTELLQSIMHPNQNISILINNLREKIDILIYEINSNSYLNEYSENELFLQEDIDVIILQMKNITGEVEGFLKKCIKNPLKNIFTEQINDIKNLEEKIDSIFVNIKEEKEGEEDNEQCWNSEQICSNLNYILPPCMKKIRLLGFMAKKASEKIQKIVNDSKIKNLDQQRKHFKFFGKANFKNNEIKVDNIEISDELKNRLKEDVTDLIFEDEKSTVRIIKGGKLMKLIECLSWPNDDFFEEINGFRIDDSFYNEFLMTHHSFISSKDLYKYIIKNYENTQPPSKLNNVEYELVSKKKIIPTQIHIVNMIGKWIETLKLEDSCMNDDIIDEYITFVDEALKSELKGFSKELKHISKNNDKKKPLLKKGNNTKSKNENEEQPVLPKHITMNNLDQLQSLLENDNHYIFSIPEKEFARQLTLIESEYYKSVTGTECLDQIWGTKRQKEFKQPSDVLEYPNVSRMIFHTNQLTTWVASCVLNSEILKERENTLKYFAQLAIECSKINNFNGVTAIVAGLSMGPVYRLHNTWRVFNEKNKELSESYSNVSDLVSPKGQYSNYRKKLKELDDKNEQIMPFLGVYFTDLTFVELGNADYIAKTSNINFEKRRKAAKIINEIKHYQNKTFNFIPVKPIQDFIINLDKYKNQPFYTEDELYDLSLKYEKREEDDDEDDE